jgi:hypothetical protein
MQQIDHARRVRAARELAGYRSADALASAIDEEGLGARTVRSIENGSRPARPRELRSIAALCRVPYEFFTVPDLAEAIRLGAAALTERDATGVAEALATDQVARRSGRSA